MGLHSEKKWDDKLAGVLRNLDKPTYPQNSQEILRHKLFRKISSLRRERPLEEMLPWYAVLAERIRIIGMETIASPVLKSRIREKILALLPVFVPVRPVFAWIRLFSAKALSFAVLAIFVFTAVFGFFASPVSVSAAPVTYLESFEGQVKIVRNGSIISARPKFNLRDRDIVRTGKGALATIHFLDDSLGRLDEESELRIERLFIHPADRTNTVVELQLRQGRLWSKVLSLVDEFARFQVKSPGAVTVAKKRAVFDVKTIKGKTTVAAIENTVDVIVSDKKTNAIDTTLMDGQKMEVNEGKAKVMQVPSRQGADQTWISQNLVADKEYVIQIAERNKETRREAIEGFNPVKVISDTTTKVFRSDVDRERAKFQAVEAKLVQAEILFEQGHAEEGHAVLADFKDLLRQSSEKVKMWEKEDSEKALVLKEAFETELKVYRKQFAIFLPSDAVYPLKEAIGEVDVMLASTPEEKTEKTLGVASEQLMDAQQMTRDGQEDLARESLQKFAATLETAQQEAENIAPEEKDNVVTVLLERQEDHLKLIQSIADKVEWKGPPVLAPKELRGVSLQEMIGQAAVAVEVIEQLSTTEQLNATGQPIIDETKKTTPLLPIPPVPATPAPLGQVLEETSPFEFPAETLSGMTVIQLRAAPSVPTFSATGSAPPK